MAKEFETRKEERAEMKLSPKAYKTKELKEGKSSTSPKTKPVIKKKK